MVISLAHRRNPARERWHCRGDGVVVRSVGNGFLRGAIEVVSVEEGLAAGVGGELFHRVRQAIEENNGSQG